MTQPFSNSRFLPSLENLAADELAKMRANRVLSSLQGARELRLIPSTPSPRQSEFLDLVVEEALYGGAAGGGKTETAIMGALQYIDVGGYAAAIFRLTKAESEMPEAPLARAREWFRPAVMAGRARWHEKSNSFFFKTKPGKPESLIHFGYFGSDADMSRYQTAAFQYIAVDELTFWAENRYRFLFSRCRPSSQMTEHVPCRVRGFTNPGGPGHKWVKERFVARAVHVNRGTEAMKDIALRRHSRVDLPKPALYVSPPSPEAIELAKELGRPARRAYFVPAFAQDNPFLVGDKLAAYRENLLMLDPTRRAQLEWGDWEVESAGGFFTAASFEVVETLPECTKWVRPWDLAATEAKEGTDPDWTASAVTGLFVEPKPSKLKRFCVAAGVEHFRDTPTKTEQRVVSRVKADGRLVRQLFEQEPGSAGKFVMVNWHALLTGYQVSGMRKTGPKSSYWGPLSGHCANVAPMLLQVRNEAERKLVAAIISELTNLPQGHDDLADMLSQGFAHFVHGGDGSTDFGGEAEGTAAPLRSARI